ncbi:MAG: hypothetical protein JWM21_3266 [Acidobacteria bacterium]|nr:hypothetical protein [Acidobacteriota bacterium]
MLGSVEQIALLRSEESPWATLPIDIQLLCSQALWADLLRELQRQDTTLLRRESCRLAACSTKEISLELTILFSL